MISGEMGFLYDIEIFNEMSLFSVCNTPTN